MTTTLWQLVWVVVSMWPEEEEIMVTITYAEALSASDGWECVILFRRWPYIRVRRVEIGMR